MAKKAVKTAVKKSTWASKQEARFDSINALKRRVTVLERTVKALQAVVYG